MFGNVYKKGDKIVPFTSNGYQQVLLLDKESGRKIIGVHVLVAMKYLNYFEGCVVHHIDGVKNNNKVSNLMVLTEAEHKKIHASKNNAFKFSQKGKVPWNKGMKMSEEFRRKCSAAAYNRAKTDKRYEDSRSCKPVYCHETQKAYSSIRAAAKDMGFRNSDIVNHLKGRQSHVRGTHWDYC